ncbi:hypothetical protein KY290_027999 [Solanum tuberosum]|uniref:Uncharacterized protein n=1 Tax=Solanum tuberosum TaxID=4113 RepID=A0ABQ7UGP8_SOLTU|nr:hypothetical protein KY290_027999 [Solanum tuberosum]
MVMGGLVVCRDDVKKWGYWFSPLMYAQNAIEFLGKSVPPNSTVVSICKLPILSEETVTDRIANTRGEATKLSTGERRSFDIVYKKAGGNEVLRSASSRFMSSRVRSNNEADANTNRKRGMILPFYPLYIEMKDQGVTEDRLELLKGVSSGFKENWLVVPPRVPWPRVLNWHVVPR